MAWLDKLSQKAVLSRIRPFPCRAFNAQFRYDRRSLVEHLESRVMLTSVGALEVWAGNTDLSANSDSFFSIDQSGYTRLGVTNAQNSSVAFSTGGVHYNFFVVVSRGQVQVDSVQGSDSTFLSEEEVWQYRQWSCQNGNVTTIGTQENSNGTYAGYGAEFANVHSWTGLTIQTGTMGLMLQTQFSLESDYLPGRKNSLRLAL